MCEDLPKYLDDPKKYCSRIDALLEQNSKEWQNVWKAAIPELSSLAASEISVINALLKPIESAFKSKDGNIRVQAFECWSHFIAQCERVIVSEKLWNVLLVPLCAHNHSLYMVLSAKLKTWDTFVDTSFTARPTIMVKAVSSILKVLYGPHSLPPACSFAKLSEPCGKLYHKIMMKCAPFDDQIHNILSYLESAIPPLSNLEHTRKLANVIWSDALKIICTNNWKTEYFEFLMRTLQSLFSDTKYDGYHLITNFLYILFNIYEPFPPDRLTPHLNLTIRCLFHSPVDAKVVGEIMNGMIKRCENPSICFTELVKELKDKINSDNKDVDVLWMAIASCYTKWLKNGSTDQEFTIAVQILLFPLDHMSELIYETKQFDALMKHWKTYYEECAKSTESKNFLQVLLEKLEACIDGNIPRLMVATLICQNIHTIVKTSDEPVPCKNVLLKISKNMPDVKTLMDSNLKSYAAKYLATVLALIQLDPTCSKYFSNVVKNVDEVSVSSRNGLGSDSSVKQESNCDKITTPLPKRTTFSEKFSSPATKKSKLDSPARTQTTPKISRIDDDDIQVVEIKPKSKNSPMTQHQLEKARSKRYIPALYQDLSQSHSQSLSQCESESIFSGTKKPNKEIDPDLFEENANLPSGVGGSNASPAIPPTLSFHSGLNSPISERSCSFLSKKSLFNESKTNSQENSDSDIEVINVKKSSESDKINHKADTAASNDRETSDKQSSKRKILKEGEPRNEVTPVKRSKRLSTKTDSNIENRSLQTARKSICTPISAQKFEKNEPKVIDLVETDSQNVFLPENCKPAGGVSSPLISLMNLKNGNGESNGKRKSLRAKKPNPLFTSQVTLRRRNSANLDSDSKRSTDSDDSYDDKKSAGNKRRSKLYKSSNSFTVGPVVVDIEHPPQLESVPATSTSNQAPCNEVSVEKEPAAVTEENPSTNVITSQNKSSPTNGKEPAMVEKNAAQVDASPVKSSQTDSVILLDDGGVEIISIDDSESPTLQKKLQENKIVENTSDESTFFEGSDQIVSNKNQTEGTANSDNVSNIVQNEANTNSSDAQRLAISPEIISSLDSGSVEEKRNDVDACTNQRTVEPNEIENNSISSGPNLNQCDTNVPSDSVNNLQTSSTQENADVEVITDKPASSDGNSSMSEIPKDQEKVANEEISLPVENCDKELKSNEDSVDKRRKKDDCDNIPTIHGYSRGSQLTKLAQGSKYMPNGLKPAKVTSPKPGKSVRFIGKPQGTSGNYPSPNVSRAMKMCENKTLQTTPTKSATTPLEEKRTFAYTPKECISPGILKRFDGVRNTSPPKSPKVVNFADNLTHVRYFEDDEESDSDSMISTGDKLSNENLLNNEPLRSQDMLYDPLQNCRDSIQNVIPLIFGSAGSETALDYFTRIGVNTVGDLASMSTLTANSIPSGDNRISRMREMLKRYDAMISKGRRRSARKRILKSPADSEIREVSCLINLLNEVEFPDNAGGSINDDEQGTPMDVDAQSDEIPTEDANTNVSKNNSPDVEYISDSCPVVQNPNENKTEFNKTKDDEEAVTIPSNKLEKLNLKPMDSVMVVIEDCNVVKETENKENVDPSLDVVPVESVLESSNVSNQEVEPMEVEPQPCDIPKLANETINESADYVCTDSTTFEQTTTDRRSITVHSIHRYSTGIEPTIKEASNAASETTENTPTKAVIVINESDSTNESVSIFAENKTIASTEQATESPEILQSAIESIIVTPPVDQDEQNKTPKETVEVINENDNCTSESVSIFADDKIVTSTKEEVGVGSQADLHLEVSETVIVTPSTSKDEQNDRPALDSQNMVHTVDVSVSGLQPQNIDNDHDETSAENLVQTQSDQNYLENVLEKFTGSWISMMRIIYPFYASTSSEEESRQRLLEILERLKNNAQSQVEK